MIRLSVTSDRKPNEMNLKQLDDKHFKHGPAKLYIMQGYFAMVFNSFSKNISKNI